MHFLRVPRVHGNDAKLSCACRADDNRHNIGALVAVHILHEPCGVCSRGRELDVGKFLERLLEQGRRYLLLQRKNSNYV
jgi:hypothetical protein